MKNRSIVILALSLFLICPLTLVHAKPFDHSHKAWTSILKRHVKTSRGTSSLHYSNLRDSPENLNHYLESLSELSEKRFNSFSSNQRLAFLINAYNAFTVKLIIDNYPVNSIKDLGGWFSSPWKRRFIPLFGTTVSLDEIEHEMIRENFNESRIHFAVNCASKSCPALRPEAYVADRLNEQLDQAASNFLNKSLRNRVDSKMRVLFLSKIFKWYRDDFEAEASSLTTYVRPYLKAAPKDLDQYLIRFLEYDWSLNEER